MRCSWTLWLLVHRNLVSTFTLRAGWACQGQGNAGAAHLLQQLVVKTRMAGRHCLAALSCCPRQAVGYVQLAAHVQLMRAA